ncbi:efflux RND transporter permease subunit, partial [Candidatus Fermentibacterales bacterium]|nr:efflux RND transporter permease subunit [Candidatus Fermentibacterales bacterium]
LAEGDDGFIGLDFTRSIGTDLESTDSTLRAVEDSVLAIIPEEHYVGMYARVGESQGVAAIFGSAAANEGSIFVRLVRSGQRDVGVEEYEDRIRAVLSHMPDVEYTLGDRGPFMGTAPIEIEIYGDDIDELRDFSELLVAGIRKIEGTREVRSSLEEQIPELSFVPDPVALSMSGLSPSQVARELMYGLMGTAASIYREGGEEYDIYVRYPERFRDSREDVSYVPVLGSPLSSWGTLEERLSPNTITRINQTRVATVSCSVFGRSLGEVTGDVMAMLDTLDTGGLRIEIGGQAKDQQETFLYLGIAILVAAALVYMVMASQFESLLEPFIIILIVPMAFIGVIWMLMVTGTVLSVVALIGVLMLSGIVVNNGIVMVDYANQLRRRGMGVIEAIIQAATVRMRPILMTAGTTSLAMVPLALGLGEGGETWAPMAVTVIGGLIAATFLTLLVEPCVYVVLGCRKKFNNKLSCNPEKRELGV